MIKLKSLIAITFLCFCHLSYAEVNADITSDLSHQVGQVMMVGFYGTEINENSTIVNEIKNYHIGGVILVDHTEPNSNKKASNIENPQQLKRLINQLQFYAKKYNDYPLFIAVNQEGGLINALKSTKGFSNSHDPSQQELGESNNLKLIYTKTYQRATLLKNMGINLNLAPVADLAINPNNPGVAKLQRSFGKNSEQVTKDLVVAISAYKKAGILCTLKHFPGLGSADKNTDYDNADVTQVWTQKELQSYKNLISANKACPLIMVTHLVNKKLDNELLPASLSKKIVTDLLVNQLHFSGLIITDDMDAAAIRKNFPMNEVIQKAILAGNNIIIFGGTQGYNPDHDADLLFATLMNLAEKNVEIRQQIQKSSNKIIDLKKQMNLQELNNA